MIGYLLRVVSGSSMRSLFLTPCFIETFDWKNEDILIKDKFYSKCSENAFNKFDQLVDIKEDNKYLKLINREKYTKNSITYLNSCSQVYPLFSLVTIPY